MHLVGPVNNFIIIVDIDKAYHRFFIVIRLYVLFQLRHIEQINHVQIVGIADAFHHRGILDKLIHRDFLNMRTEFLICINRIDILLIRGYRQCRPADLREKALNVLVKFAVPPGQLLHVIIHPQDMPVRFQQRRRNLELLQDFLLNLPVAGCKIHQLPQNFRSVEKVNPQNSKKIGSTEDARDCPGALILPKQNPVQ